MALLCVLSTNYQSVLTRCWTHIARDEDQKQVTELGSCEAEPTTCTPGSYYHNAHMGRGQVRQVERMNTEWQAHKSSPRTEPMFPETPRLA